MPSTAPRVKFVYLSAPLWQLQEYTPHMGVLQPALAAAGLGGHCHMSVEWARAVREAVKVGAALTANEGP